MSGNYLLDSNVIIALFAGEATVRERLLASEGVYTSVIVIAELMYGALGSRQTDENLRRIVDFTAASVVLSPDATTAHNYAAIKVRLREAGTPIPDHDIWIYGLLRRQFSMD